jgi:hypothetical protein
VQVIEQRRVDGVLLAVAIIAQKYLRGRQGAGDVGVVPKELELDRLRSMQIAQCEALDGG